MNDVKELIKQLLEIQSGAMQKRAEIDIDKEAAKKMAKIDEDALQQMQQLLGNFAKKKDFEYQLSLALTGYII